MNALLMLLLALTGDPAGCPMHAKHTAGAQHDAHAHHEEVNQRGDAVMGFSHEKTKHTFRLTRDGGAVEVRATDAADAESVALIRAHLREIAKEFAAGNFTKPREIHDREPHGVPVMKELGAAIRYQYEDVERGGRVRIVTKNRRGIEAAHQFLRFQIDDHRTGDPGKVE